MVTVDFPRRITAVEARQSIWFQAKLLFFLGGKWEAQTLLNMFFMIKVMLCVFILPEWMLSIISNVQILQNSYFFLYQSFYSNKSDDLNPTISSSALVLPAGAGGVQ